MEEIPYKLSNAEDARRSAMAFVVLLIASLIPSFMRMSDIPFVNDEPMLLLMALQGNMSGRPPSLGLVGSYGVRYGPVIVWAYQILLMISRDPIVVATIKSIICWSVILGSSVWIGKRLRLGYWPLLLLPLGPNAWFYQRSLWDNCFLLPVSAVLMLLFVEFLIKPRVWILALMAATGALMFHIHLMSLMVIGPIGLISIIAARDWLRKNLLALVGVLGCSIGACVPYIVLAIRTQSSPQGNKARDAAVHGIVGGIAGARYFTHWGFDRMPEFYSDNRLLPVLLIKLLVVLSCIVLAMFVVGAVCIARSCLAKRNTGEPFEPREWMALMSLLVIASLTAFFVIFGYRPLFQYYHASWFTYFFFVWVGFDRVMTRRWGTFVLGVNVAALCILVVAMLLHISITGGNRSLNYGSTIGNQMAIAEELMVYIPKVQVRVRSNTRTESIKVLMALRKVAQNAPDYKGLPVAGIVEYANPGDPLDARLRVRIEPLAP